MVTTKFIVENGIGHYEVSNGVVIVTCDCGEVQEFVREFESAAE